MRFVCMIMYGYSNFHFQNKTPENCPLPFTPRASKGQLQLEVSQQSRFAQDLHVAQLHNDTAVELQSQRLDERLGRLEEEWKMRKVYKSAGELWPKKLMQFCFLTL